jgi:integrase
MPRPRPPYLQHEKTRHGKWVWYVRKGDGPRIRIHAEFGTPEFDEQYQAVVRGEKPQPKARTKIGTLRWLYERYHESAKWLELSPATRRVRENIYKNVMATAGDEPFTAITQKHIEEGKDRRRLTPCAARDFLDVMRGLFRWAKEAKHVAVDPTADVKNPARRTTDGFPAWTIDDVARYEARWPAGTRQRVWLHTLLYIGCRRGDAVVLGRQHIRDGVITFVTEKGRNKRRIEVSRRIEPELAATLAQGPTADLAFVCGEYGKPLTKESFGNDFSDACRKAGIKKSAHGVRKLSATMWAERGATEMELMAMFGWLTPQMAALYTRSASRRKMSLNAQARLLGTSDEHSIPAPTQEVRGTGQKG